MTRAFEIFENLILSLFPDHNHEEYLEKRRQALAVLDLLQQDLRNLVSTQAGRHPSDAESQWGVYTDAYIAVSPFVRWQKRFAKLDMQAVSKLEGLFADLVELGFAFHLLHWDAPKRPDPANVTDISELRHQWLSEAYIADSRMKQAERELYHGLGTVVFDKFIQTDVLPFYKAHGLCSGLLGSFHEGQYLGHAKMLFYAGARLAVMYDVCTNAGGRLIPS